MSSRGIVGRSVAAWTGALCLLPFIYLAMLSLAASWPFPRLLPTGLDFGRWADLFARREGPASSFLLSCSISAAVALVSTASGYITGRFVAYHRRRPLLLFLAYLPFAVSPVILGVSILFLYIKLGLVGTALGVVMAQTIFAFGFAIIFFSAFWNTHLKALEELVLTLGGSTWQAFREVLVPVSKGAILVCLFQTFLLSWFQYGLTVLVGAGKVQTLPVKVFIYIGEADIYLAAMASCLLALVPVLLLWTNKRFVFERL